MATPRVLVLRSPGANCDEETAEAFRLAGGAVDRLHVNRLLENPAELDDRQVLCIPGGFSYGDDVAAGRVLGNRLRLALAEALQRFRDRGGVVLGICNGFQVLMKTGLLDIDDADGPRVTLTWNDHGRYEARWVRLGATPGECVLLRGIDAVELPIAHAEGRIVFRDPAAGEGLAAAGRVVLRYTDESGEPATGFPTNPNGSAAAAAALCDSTGRVLGMMPHPERFLFATQHPRWTRQRAAGGFDADAPGAGLRVFQNAIDYFG